MRLSLHRSRPILLNKLALAALPVLALTALGASSGKFSLASAEFLGGLLGGLALFLFGIDLLSENMQKTAGNGMRAFLAAMTRSRWSSLFAGLVVTVLMQSSSATTVLLVSFSQAHLVNAVQSVGVILGSNIGTTMTTQLIAFKITDYSLLIVAAGYLFATLSRNRRAILIGYAITGVGFIFFGMHLMSGAMNPLRSEPWFAELLLHLKNPLVGILAAAAMTAVIQSSAAFTGIIIVLGQQGLMTLETSIPLILGANVGTCATALLASMKASREAKRVALIHVIFNLAGVILFLPFVDQLAHLTRVISPPGGTSAANLPRQIANAHTLFNVLACLGFLPFTKRLAALAGMILPVTAEEFKEMALPKYLDPSLLGNPSLALERVRLELIYIGEIVEGMIADTMEGFLKKDSKRIQRVVKADDKVDGLIEQTNAYLTSVLRTPLSAAQVDEARVLADILSEMDHLADLLETSTSRIVLRKIEDRVYMSEEGIQEVDALFKGVLAAFSGAMRFVAEPNLDALAALNRSKATLEEIEQASRHIHYERLAAGIPESVESHQFHMDMLDQLRIMRAYISEVIKQGERFLREYQQAVG